MVAFGIIAAVVLVLGLVLVGMYNGMVRGRNMAEEAWSGIDVQLKRRHDLVPNLVNAVQGYAAHEKEVFAAIAEARSAIQKASGVQAVAQAESMLSSALGRLFAVAEAYPELKADGNFRQLQDTLASLEDEIQMSRRLSNCVKISFLRKIMLSKNFRLNKRQYQQILTHPKFLKKN